MHPVDEAIRDIETAEDGGASIISLIDPKLLNAVCPILQQFTIADQMIGCAAIFGMICASVEGEPVPIESERGVLITFEDRLRLFVAQTKAVYTSAYLSRAHPDCPDPIKRM